MDLISNAFGMQPSLKIGIDPVTVEPFDQLQPRSSQPNQSQVLEMFQNSIQSLRSKVSANQSKLQATVQQVTESLARVGIQVEPVVLDFTQNSELNSIEAGLPPASRQLVSSLPSNSTAMNDSHQENELENEKGGYFEGNTSFQAMDESMEMDSSEFIVESLQDLELLHLPHGIRMAKAWVEGETHTLDFDQDV